LKGRSNWIFDLFYTFPKRSFLNSEGGKWDVICFRSTSSDTNLTRVMLSASEFYVALKYKYECGNSPVCLMTNVN